MHGTECISMQLHKKYLCNTDDVVTLQSEGLGNYNVFKFDRCSPNAERLVQAEESSPTPVKPCPMNAKHMILIRAFFDCDVVSHDTRYAKDPRITNFGNNILEVRFLTKYGAQLIYDDEEKTAFYYQVRDVQLIITMNIKGKEMLIKNYKNGWVSRCRNLVVL